MAAGVSRGAARRFMFTLAWSCPTFCKRIESQAASALTVRAGVFGQDFSSSNVGAGGICSRARRSGLRGLAAVQSLLPLHTATAAAQLVSRLTTSSLNSPLLQGSWLVEDI